MIIAAIGPKSKNRLSLQGLHVMTRLANLRIGAKLTATRGGPMQAALATAVQGNPDRKKFWPDCTSNRQIIERRKR